MDAERSASPQFSRRSLGDDREELQSKPVQLSWYFWSLLQRGVIGLSMQEGWLFVELTCTDAWRIAFRHKSSLSDRVDRLVDLTKLIFASFPDPFAEPLWETLCHVLQEVILSTVLPFLSVTSLAELAGNTK